MQKFIVSRDDSVYEAWPDVELCDSGRMVCVFTECTHHTDRNGSRLAIVTSDNRGRTWSTKRYLTEKGTENGYFNNVRIIKHSDGRLVIVCDFLNGRGETPELLVNAHNYIWFSSDEGETWSEPMDTPVRGICPTAVLELQSGRWLLAAQQKDFDHGKLYENIWYSDDKGKTWSEKITMANDSRYNLCEAYLCEVEPNVIVSFMRENSAMGWDCMKSISKDGGETWEGVYNVPLPGCHRPTAKFMADGNLLLTYRYRPGGKGWVGYWTQNTFGAILYRDGLLSTERKDQATRNFPIDYDRSSVSDCGYTGWVQYPDGEIYIVNYLVDDAPKAHIRGYSLRPDELFIETPRS